MIGVLTPQANRLWRLMAAALALMTALLACNMLALNKAGGKDHKDAQRKWLVVI